MQVNSNNSRVFFLNLVHNCFERCSSSAPDIQEVSRTQSHLIDEAEMSGYSKKGTNEKIVNIG